MCLLVVLFVWVDLATFWESLAALSPGVVLLLVALATLDRFLMAGKWRHIAAGTGFHAPMGTFLRAYYGASFLSYVLPTTIGGDVYRGMRGAREAPLSRVLASMVMERWVGVLASLVLAGAGLIWLLAGPSGSAVLSLPGGLPVWLGAGLAALFASLWLSFQPGPQAGLLRLAGRLGLAGPIGAWLDAHRSYASRPGLLIVNGLLALLENGVQIAILFVAAREIGVENATIELLSVISLARFVRRLSMLLDGWGFSEALHILLFGWIGIAGGTALAISLVGHAAGIVASLPGACFVWVDRRDVRAAGERVRTNDEASAPVPRPEVVRNTVLRDPRSREGESSGGS